LNGAILSVAALQVSTGHKLMSRSCWHCPRGSMQRTSSPCRKLSLIRFSVQCPQKASPISPSHSPAIRMRRTLQASWLCSSLKGVVQGQEFLITVRRLATRNAPRLFSRPPGFETGSRTHTVASEAARLPSTWRYITGSFAIRIPVSVPEEMVPIEHDT
jgi:hypothetical protein